MFDIMFLGTFNKLGDLPIFKKNGGDIMGKKDFLILSLILIIFLLLLLLFKTII